MEQRFHGSDADQERYSQNILDRAVADKRISQRDRDLLVEFMSSILAKQEQLSPRRRYKIYYTLIRCRSFLGVPYDKATIKELHQAAAGIKSSPDMKKNTKADFVRFLKRFFLWLSKNKHSKIPTEEIREIKSPRYDSNTKTAEMMLTDEEVKAIVSACNTTRDRAFVMLLYEGGFRIGELASLTWSQVKIDEEFALINVSGKTEIPRLVPCRDAKEYLLQYMNDYQIPTPPPKEDLVFWVVWKGKRVQMTYNGMAKAIKEAATRAGIQKRITPHLFRHSSITQAVKDGMGEQVIKSIYWGNADTAMLKTYSHITGQDIINAVKERYGIETEPKKKKDRKTFGPIQCTACGFVNVPTNRHCGKCGEPLTEEARKRKAEATHEVRTHPELPRVLRALGMSDKAVAEIMKNTQNS